MRSGVGAQTGGSAAEDEPFIDSPLRYAAPERETGQFTVKLSTHTIKLIGDRLGLGTVPM